MLDRYPYLDYATEQALARGDIQPGDVPRPEPIQRADPPSLDDYKYLVGWLESPQPLDQIYTGQPEAEAAALALSAPHGPRALQLESRAAGVWATETGLVVAIAYRGVLFHHD